MLGLDALEPAQELRVVVEGQPVVQAVDDVDLGDRLAGVDARLQLAPGLLELHGVGAGVALLEARERAEHAAGHADVGGVDVEVAVEVGAVAVQPLAHLVGQRARPRGGWGAGTARRRRRGRAARRPRTLSRISRNSWRRPSLGRRRRRSVLRSVPPPAALERRSPAPRIERGRLLAGHGRVVGVVAQAQGALRDDGAERARRRRSPGTSAPARWPRRAKSTITCGTGRRRRHRATKRRVSSPSGSPSGVRQHAVEASPPRTSAALVQAGQPLGLASRRPGSAAARASRSPPRAGSAAALRRHQRAHAGLARRRAARPARRDPPPRRRRRRRRGARARRRCRAAAASGRTRRGRRRPRAPGGGLAAEGEEIARAPARCAPRGVRLGDRVDHARAPCGGSPQRGISWWGCRPDRAPGRPRCRCRASTVGGLRVERGGGRQHHRAGAGDGQHVLEVDHRQRRLAHHQHQLAPLLEHDVGGAADEVVGDAVGDAGEAARRAGNRPPWPPSRPSPRRRGAEVVELPALERVGGLGADLVAARPRRPTSRSTSATSASRRAGAGQHVEQALGVDRARGAADRDHQLHRATTSEATPDGKRSCPLTSANPTGAAAPRTRRG